MRYPRWFRLLLAALLLQLSTVDPLWAQGELSFTRQDFVVGRGAGQVTVGDFNDDSQQDLAIANEGLAILLGNGDGTFSRVSPDPAFPDPEFGVVLPSRVTVGDFNGDGQQDLATAATGFNRVHSLMGRGDGTFEPAQRFVVMGPKSITVGDFDGDSQQDLATANEGVFGTPSSVSILLGRGNGTFEPAQDFGVGVSPESITVGDFNGDSQQDLAIANGGANTGGTMSILLGQGDGTFEPAQDFAVGQQTTSVTVGDFNSDGRQDLATTIDFVSVSILLGRGDGTFEPGQVFRVGVRPAFPNSIQVGDFNGDSQQDLVTTSPGRDSVSIALGSGDGTFEPTQDFGVGMRPASVTVGDFNGDGRQDLATAYNNVTRELNNVGTVAILINIASVETTTYRLTRIGDEVTCAPAVSSCFPTITDMNDGAAVVGTTKSLGGEPPRAILLRGGMMIELGDLMAGAAPNAGATAINDHSQITGTNQIHDASGNLVTRGFFWENGQIRDLGVDGDATPLDINDVRPMDNPPQPQIVGQVVVGNVGMPFLWDAGRTTLLETLFCPGNLGGSARAINNNGVIVGSSNSTVGKRAVIWQAGGVGITPLEPPFVLEVGEAVDVNDRGDVIGFYFNSSDPQTETALLWQGNKVTVLLPLDRAEANGARPESINDRGQIVGSTHFGSGQSLATLWQDGGAALDLNELVSDDDPAKAFVTLITAVVINDYGLIVVLGEDSRVPVGQEGRDAHYLLTPTGIPASSAATPSPSASSPLPSDNGGGAVDRLSLLLLVIVMSASAACTRRRQQARVARPFD